LKLLGRANGLSQFINRRALIVNRKLRVANDVDEQDMGDLELDLFLNFGGHSMTPLAIVREQSFHCYSIGREQRDKEGAVDRTARGRLRSIAPTRVVYFSCEQGANFFPSADRRAANPIADEV
jgi:hypothetical protein